MEEFIIGFRISTMLSVSAALMPSDPALEAILLLNGVQ